MVFLYLNCVYRPGRVLYGFISVSNFATIMCYVKRSGWLKMEDRKKEDQSRTIGVKVMTRKCRTTIIGRSEGGKRRTGKWRTKFCGKWRTGKCRTNSFNAVIYVVILQLLHCIFTDTALWDCRWAKLPQPQVLTVMYGIHHVLCHCVSLL